MINSGKYQLLPDFRNIFLPENDNCPEILFSVQASINDGSPNNYNGNPGDRLLPPGGPYPNYGFLRPSQNLVNAYKTDSNGLPLEDGIDVSENDYVDTRLDHTVARPGLLVRLRFTVRIALKNVLSPRTQVTIWLSGHT